MNIGKTDKKSMSILRNRIVLSIVGQFGGLVAVVTFCNLMH